MNFLAPSTTHQNKESFRRLLQLIGRNEGQWGDPTRGGPSRKTSQARSLGPGVRAFGFDNVELDFHTYGCVRNPN